MGKKKKNKKPKPEVEEKKEAAREGTDEDTDEDAPEDFLCALTLQILRDPAIAGSLFVCFCDFSQLDGLFIQHTLYAAIADCGHTFERRAILQWLQANSVCLICQKDLGSKTERLNHLVRNYALKAVIERFLEERPKQKMRKRYLGD